MRTAFVETLLEEAKLNPSIILITGDLGFGVLEKFQSEVPKQFINSGVAEQAMMGMAAGIASTGKRVFVYSIANFPTIRCLEQIRNDVCLMNNPVVVVSVGSGYSYGNQGYTHHALEDIAVMRALPNMQVISPADPIETIKLTRFLSSTKKPSYLRLGKSGEPNINLSETKIFEDRINEIIHGDDGTLLFSGSIGSIAITAQKLLLREKISVSVASVPFISAIDVEYLLKASRKGPIVTIEEHSSRGGLGSAVLECASLNNIRADIRIVASEQNNLSQIGSQDFLRASNGLTAERVFNEFLGAVAD
jgi:transketolase